MSKKTAPIVTGGILTALGCVLSLIKIFELPFGGGVTLFGMVPVTLFGYMYAAQYGLICGTVFGVLQAVLGTATSGAFAGVTGAHIILMILLDYILAFAVLGLSGMFRQIIKNPFISLPLGSLTVWLLRFLCHFASGVLLWGGYAADFFKNNIAGGEKIISSFSSSQLVCLYSLIYNAGYMLPEIAVNLFAVFLLLSVKPIRKIITKKQ
ncbi:MAG: energy-coupled thiamine transporter ThiT [Acutalibacteraceae bacterium]